MKPADRKVLIFADKKIKLKKTVKIQNKAIFIKKNSSRNCDADSAWGRYS